jgi:hypothetical protein
MIDIFFPARLCAGKDYVCPWGKSPKGRRKVRLYPGHQVTLKRDGRFQKAFSGFVGDRISRA